MSARQYFCCCIPVRIAVFVTSLIALLFSGAVAGIAFFLLADTKDTNAAASRLTSEQKIAVGVVGGVYTLIALASLFGFIGAIIRKRGFVRLYSTMAFIIFFIQCAASGYLIFSLFHHTKCEIVTSNSGDTQPCEQVSTGAKVGIVCFLVIQLIVQAYIVSIIRRYVTQLEDEQTYRGTSGYADAAFRMNPTAGQKYQPVDQGLLQPQGTYPYADPHHAFGQNQSHA